MPLTHSIVADRFIANGASWIDLATGAAVNMRVFEVGERVSQLLWSDRCAALARLRHPLLNPLIDFGALNPGRLFEAYAVLPPIRARAMTGARLRAHALQFLRAHGGDARPAELLLRPTAPGTGPRQPRPLGIVLQERAALAAVVDVLDAAEPGGACLVTICGPPGSGLRTLAVLAARAARIRGYVPVSTTMLATRPWVTGALCERHVCVLGRDFNDGTVRAAVVRLLGMLGAASTRRHVVIAFTREVGEGEHVIPIGPLGTTAMTAMVFGENGEPSPSALFDAARTADGNPGVFLERLGAHAFDPHVPRPLVAHESAQPYGGSTLGSARGEEGPAAGQAGRQRTSGVLARAVARADVLAARGRHAMAQRLLSRAGRVLSARGEGREAARCAERLGRLHLERGRIRDAVAVLSQSRAADADPGDTQAAGLHLATAWIEDARLAEAEALLRSMAVAATVQHMPCAEVACALANCLYWQGRYGEAAVILEPYVGEGADPACLAQAARMQLAEASTVQALQLARRAREAAGAGAPGGVTSVAARTLALALDAAGDHVGASEQVRTALAAARRAHLPLEVLRARLTHLQIAARQDPRAAALRRLAVRMSGLAAQASLPRLARYEMFCVLEHACGLPSDPLVLAVEREGLRYPGARERSLRGALTELETMLDVCQTAAEDGEALDRLCAEVLERLRPSAVVIVTRGDRRVAGHAGRGWDGQSPIVDRAVASGTSVAPLADGPAARLEAAEPVKFGGEIIGAVACRWVAGSAVSRERCEATLRACALGAAAPLRAVLDRAAPQAPDPAWTDLLGTSHGAVALREAVARAARAPYSVLIEGESGSGKELVARAIHRLSVRRDRRFCAVNCAALTDELVEAELFGHARGAFTGAVGERAGLFEEADGGTLLLDEIGELSPRAQAKLLRVLQEGEIRRVGETFARRIDVRIVAATNRQLEREAAAGRFRTDLRFRLDVIRIVVPPLRERAADVPLLALHFWNDAARRVGSRATLSPDALAALARYDWPGNVRELQNVIAWVAVHSPRRGRIGASALPAAVAGSATPAEITFERAREEFERRFIRGALARANGQRARAAAALGVTRQGLAKMMRRLGIDEQSRERILESGKW